MSEMNKKWGAIGLALGRTCLEEHPKSEKIGPRQRIRPVSASKPKNIAIRSLK